MPPTHGLTPSFPATIPLAESEPEGEESPSPSALLEFYDFVGFREAISPALYDVLKQFVSDRGITMGQLNRWALAAFIHRPELGSHILITAVEPLPQSVNGKSNQDGGDPLSAEERSEVATYRLTLLNCGHDTIHIHEGRFLPKTVEIRRYDSVGEVAHASLDHTGHIPVRLRPLTEGMAITFPLDLTIPPQSSRDAVFWFYEKSKPSLSTICGQVVLDGGTEMALSDDITLILHGDSPIPKL